MTGINPAPGLVTREIPDGGLCLSSFLVIIDRNNGRSVLLGLLNPAAPWDHIGALDESRVETHSQRWMLPSSHLMIHESPQEAAARVAREQLELRDIKLGEPKIVSEVYPSKRDPDGPKHWDVEFIFKSSLAQDQIAVASAWKRLEFVDLSKTSKSEIARSHEDILESAGLRFGIT